MYKGLLFVLLVSIGALIALEIPQSTDNESMGKYERLNKIESDVIKLATEVNSLKQKIATLEQKLNSIPQ